MQLCVNLCCQKLLVDPIKLHTQERSVAPKNLHARGFLHNAQLSYIRRFTNATPTVVEANCASGLINIHACTNVPSLCIAI